MEIVLAVVPKVASKQFPFYISVLSEGTLTSCLPPLPELSRPPLLNKFSLQLENACHFKYERVRNLSAQL